MARKKKTTEIVEVTETVETAKTVETAEVTKPDETSAAPSEFITVRAVGSNQYEPFQRIPIPTDHGVPVKMSNWVRVQLKAGVIVEC